VGARALIALALVAACAGPRPSVSVVAVAPSPQPGHERVTLAVRNAGGHGEIELAITLRGRDGSVVRDTRTLDLDAGQRVVVAIDVAAPPGQYAATASALYPD
jgi:hypothetical protein